MHDILHSDHNYVQLRMKAVEYEISRTHNDNQGEDSNINEVPDMNELSAVSPRGPSSEGTAELICTKPPESLTPLSGQWDEMGGHRTPMHSPSNRMS
jgi:hypothetical protein